MSQPVNVFQGSCVHLHKVEILTVVSTLYFFVAKICGLDLKI